MKLSELRKMSRNLPRFYAANAPASLQDHLLELGIESGNFYQELEMDSAYVDTHRDTGYSNAHMQFHSHAFYELICCRNTCGAEYLMGSERYKLQKGDIIFVPPNVSHRPMLPDHMSEPYSRDVLWISEQFLRGASGEYPALTLERFSSPALFRTAGTKWEYLCDLFRQGVLEAETAHLGWQAIVSANTLTILIHLCRCMDDPAAKPLKAEQPDLLDQVLAYVELHLAEKITLADVSHHFYVSESTITQTFRRRMGISFYRCVTQRRLMSAKMLIERQLPMESVAEQVGFTDYSSFFRAFKQEYGISPRQYRKMQNE